MPLRFRTFFPPAPPVQRRGATPQGFPIPLLGASLGASPGRKQRCSRPGSLGLLAAIGLLSGCGSGPPANVILVTLDTTRADYLSTYVEDPTSGDVTISTPAFDSLAEQGQLFELALSSASVTPVSHASILTGRDPHNHGLRILSADGGYRLPADVPTLASILAREGYATAAVHSAFPVSAHFGFDRDFDVFESFDLEMQKRDDRHRWRVETNQRRSDETTDIVLDVLAELPEPYFLWIHYWDPHDAKKLPPKEFLVAAGHDPEGWNQSSRRRYAVEVSYLDSHFGRVLDWLRANGTFERTLIGVTADHGEGLGEHDWQGHRLLYQEQIHVPLILSLPGAPKGVRVPELVRTTDVVPTLLDYLSLPLPPGVDGRSLRPLIEGKEDEARIAYSDQINGYDKNANILRRRPDDDFLYCLVEYPWKLVYNPGHPGRSELFHLANDPDEAENLFLTKAKPRDRLLLELAQRSPWVTKPFPAYEDFDASANDGVSEALSDLGYAEALADLPDEDHWRWTCVRHLELEQAEKAPCPQCQGPPLLRAKR